MKVLVTDMHHGSVDEEAKVLEKAGIEIDTSYCRNEEDLIRNGQGAIGFLIAYSRVTRRVMEALPDLKIIVKYGIGVDTIDVDAATSLGKYVANVPDYCLEEVAAHALGLLVGGLRKIPQFARSVREKDWDVDPEAESLRRPSSVRLGLVGYGRIARQLAFLSRNMFREILFVDPYVDSTAVGAVEARQVATVEELFEQCGAISVHAPLNEHTRNLVGSEALSKGDNVVLVNTSRGPVVSKDAVHEGLSRGWLSFYGADVFWDEPPDFEVALTRELLSDPRVCITPHVAWCSTESAREVRMKAAEEVLRVATGAVPVNLVNKNVLNRGEQK